MRTASPSTSAVLAASGYDDLATVLDEGGQVFLGVASSTGDTAPSATSVIERVQRLLDMLGLDSGEVSGQLVLTPACGLAGATPSYAAQVLRSLQEAAGELG